MRALLIISLVCALMSLLAVLEFSAMTIVPSPRAESERRMMMLVAGAFFIGWLCLAFWVRARQRTPIQLFGRLLIFVGIIFVLGVLFFVIG